MTEEEILNTSTQNLLDYSFAMLAGELVSYRDILTAVYKAQGKDSFWRRLFGKPQVSVVQIINHLPKELSAYLNSVEGGHFVGHCRTLEDSIDRLIELKVIRSVYPDIQPLNEFILDYETTIDREQIKRYEVTTYGRAFVKYEN